jgi:hypothetical protein
MTKIRSPAALTIPNPETMIDAADICGDRRQKKVGEMKLDAISCGD